MRKSYPSDITRERFEVIRPILDRATKTTHPRNGLYGIFCAVLRLIKEGRSWRAAPHDFPKQENARYHYDIWAKPDENGFSLLDGILRGLVGIGRETDGREARTAMLVIDSKTSRNADAAETKGYGTGKKTGIKRRVGGDILGLPHIISLAAAGVAGRDGAVGMIARFCDAVDYLDLLKKVMTGGGYTGDWKNCERLLRNSLQMISLAFIRLLLARY